MSQRALSIEQTITVGTRDDHLRRCRRPRATKSVCCRSAYMASDWRPKMTREAHERFALALAHCSPRSSRFPICFIPPTRAMLQAAFRSTAARSVAYRSVRCMASKPPRRPANPPPSPPPRAPPPASEIPAEAPKPVPSSQIVPSLDFDPSAEDAKQERTGARSSKDSLSSIERRRRFLGRVSLAMLLVGAGVATWQMGSPLDEEELRARRWVRTGRVLR